MSKREDLAAKAAAEVDRWEKSLGDELARLFDRQQAVVLARLQGTKARKHTRHWEPPGERKIDPSYVADAARWVKDAAGSVAPIIRRIYTAVWERVSTQLGGPAVDPDALEAAVQARLDLIASGVDTATQEVTDFIAREEDAGTPMPDIVKGIRDLYEQRTAAWVQRITTISAVGSINHASLSAAFAAGSQSKQWLSRRDNKVRDTHQHADGQVVPILAKFKLGGIPTHPVKSELLYPGDPDPAVPIDEVINCRCTMLFAPVPAGAGGSGGVLGGSGATVAGAAAAVASVAAGAAAAKGSAAAAALAAKAGLVAGVVTAGAGVAAGAAASDHGQVDDQQQSSQQRQKADDEPLELKDRVRTPSGARHYGQPIGSIIVPNPTSSLVPQFTAPGAPSTTRLPVGKPAPGKVVGHIGNAPVDLAGEDPSVRALIAKYATPGGLPEPGKTQVLALRGKDGRVGAYIVWQTEDGAKPKGTILEVSVHPKLRGHGIGNDLVAMAAKYDPNVQPTSRPATSAPGAPKSSTVSRPMPGSGPVIRSRATAADRPGTSGDFNADAARIDRLQRAYMKDGVDTRSLYGKGGRWSRAREAQQQAVIDHFLSKPTVKKDHKILVLGGLPGAGKTTTINSAVGQQALGINLADYVEVNADEVKAEMIKRGMIPDYPGLSPDEAATLYHDESFEIAHSLMRQAAKRKMNFAYDTSLKSSGQVGFATSAGSRTMPPPWETTIVLVDVPIAVAKQRARDRYLNGGRYMPLALIDKMKPYGKSHSSLPSENFDVVKRQADRWVVFDNAGADPVVVGQGGKRTRTPRAHSARIAPAQGVSAAAVTPAAQVAAAAPAPAVSSPGPAVPAGMPPVPAGAVVYAHPQGKHIYVLPDGSMQVWKPGGKRGTSSATAAELAQGYGSWTRLGAASSAPAPAPARTGSSPSIVAAPSAPLQQSAGAPAPAGSLPVTPMDFNEAPLSDVPKYIADPNYVFQQKVDGIRGVLVVEPGKQPWFASKKGDRLQSSTAAKITGPMLAKMPPAPAGTPAYRVEGELLNGKFHVFDMYTVGGEQVPYEQRKAMADAWVDAVSPAMPQAVKLPTAVTAAEKQKLWDEVVKSGAEGVMMKRKDSPYSGGARVSHTLKAKVTSTADVVVLAKGLGGKDNAEIGLLVNGKVQSIGTVSTLGKGPLAVGDVVEVEYLWATPGNSLAQPRIKRKRPDKTVNDLTDASQLRLVDKTVLSVAQKALLGRLEAAVVEMEVQHAGRA